MTNCVIEIRCLLADISPINDDSIVPYKICSFDIEASSSHGDFPIPKKTYFRPATSIVEIYSMHRKSIVRKNANVESIVQKNTNVENNSLELFKEILKASFGLGLFDGIVPVHTQEILMEDTLWS